MKGREEGAAGTKLQSESGPGTMLGRGVYGDE